MNQHYKKISPETDKEADGQKITHQLYILI